MERLDTRAIAVEWAQTALADDTVTKQYDKPHMETLLTELAMFQQPIKSLSLSIHDNQDHYTVTIKGYTRAIRGPHINDVLFNPLTRSQAMDNVMDWYIQIVDSTPAIIVTMKKIVFHTPRSHKPTVPSTISDESTTPSAARRFRKRTY